MTAPIWRNGDPVPRNKFRADKSYRVVLLDGTDFEGEFLTKHFRGGRDASRTLSRREVTALFWVHAAGGSLRSVRLQEQVASIAAV